jgi:hypothetical protein
LEEREGDVVGMGVDVPDDEHATKTAAATTARAAPTWRIDLPPIGMLRGRRRDLTH